MIGFRALIVALATAFASISDAGAASVRPIVTISGGNVRLSDLFAGLLPMQDCVLGDGPRPGERIIIAAPQLQAIADQYGVDWPHGVGPDSVTLFRPGITLDRNLVVRKLGVALTPLGMRSNDAITLERWAGMTVDPSSQVDVADPAYDAVTGIFSADLVVSVGGVETARARLSGKVEQLVDVVVPTRPIVGGDIIGMGDLMTERMPDQGSSAALVTTEGEAVGQMVIHALAPGRPVRRDDLRQPLLVRRGSIITVRLSANGVELAEEGQAVDTGSAGDRVRIMNVSSRAVIVGVVDGPNDVTVDTTSLPTTATEPTGLPPMLAREASIGMSAAGSMP